MAKTEIIIDPKTLSSKLSGGKVIIDAIINDKSTKLESNPTANFIDDSNFSDTALFMNNKNTIIVSGTKATKTSNTLVDLRSDNFTLQLDFTCLRTDYETLSQNSYSGDNDPNRQVFGTKNQTLFFNTLGYFKVSNNKGAIVIEVLENGAIRKFPQPFNGSTKIISIKTGCHDYTQTVDGKTKYRILIKKINNIITASFYDITTTNNPTEPMYTRSLVSSTSTDNFILDTSPLDKQEKEEGWHTCRIGNHHDSDNKDTNGVTDEFYGWFHYFSLIIEKPPVEYSKDNLLLADYKIEPKTLTPPKELEISYKTRVPYEKRNFFIIKYAVEVPITDYENPDLLDIEYEINPKPLTPPKELEITYINRRTLDEKILDINYNVKKRPVDPGDVVRKFDTLRKVLLYVSPFNYEDLKKDTKRIISDRVLTLNSETMRIVERDEDPPPDIGTLDDEDIIFEIAKNSIFFMEVDTSTNSLNLYRKESLDSQSILLASLNQISGTTFQFDEVWNHLAMTYDKNTNELSVFVNGKKAYTTTDVKDLEWGYMQFNTFRTNANPTYFTGVTLTDSIKYINSFAVNSVPIRKPLTPFANIVELPRTIVIRPIPSKPNIIYTGYVVPYPRQILKIFTVNIPVKVVEQKIIYASARINVFGYAVQTYVSPPNSTVLWKGARVFGPLLTNPDKIPGIIRILPAYVPIKGYSSIRKYAENWTLNFWYLRYSLFPNKVSNILEIKGPYGTFTLTTETFGITFGSIVETTPTSSLIPVDKWIHMMVVYNVYTGNLVVYINGTKVYVKYIRLASPFYFIFFIGFDPNNCNYFGEIELTDDNPNGPDEPDNPDEPETPDPNPPPDEPPDQPKDPEITEVAYSTERTIIDDPIVDVEFFNGGIDQDTIDYRLFLYRRATINRATKPTPYKFDVKYIGSKQYHHKNAEIGLDPEKNWPQVRAMGPSGDGSIGYIYYKSQGQELVNTDWTIDFWVYMEDNHVDDINYPLIDMIGDTYKRRYFIGEKNICCFSHREIHKDFLEDTISNSRSEISTLIGSWIHVAITYISSSGIIYFYANGLYMLGMYISTNYDKFPLREIYIYTNTTNKNTQYITSIRISSINRFSPVGEDFNINKVNRPYGEKLISDSERIVKITEKKYSGDIEYDLKRNVILGAPPVPPPNLSIDPLSGKPIDYDKHHMPWAHSLRKVANTLDPNLENSTERIIASSKPYTDPLVRSVMRNTKNEDPSVRDVELNVLSYVSAPGTWNDLEVETKFDPTNPNKGADSSHGSSNELLTGNPANQTVFIFNTEKRGLEDEN